MLFHSLDLTKLERGKNVKEQNKELCNFHKSLISLQLIWMKRIVPLSSCDLLY